MSTFEQLFVDPGHDDAGRAAAALAEALGLRITHPHDRLHLGSSRLTDDVAHVGGALETNTYGDLGPDDPAAVAPEDESIFDGAPLVWSLWADTDGDPAEQQRRARVAFDLVVTRLGWPAILTHNFDVLVATYDPERGLREFPPGTPSDGTGRAVWG